MLHKIIRSTANIWHNNICEKSFHRWIWKETHHLDNLAILRSIRPAGLRRKGTSLSLARRAMEHGHLLHLALTCAPSANARLLKSRHVFATTAQQLTSSSDNNIRAALWEDYRWNTDWLDNTSYFHSRLQHPPLWKKLPKPAWVRIDRLRSGVGCFSSAWKIGVWYPLRPVSVAQKNILSTMWSSNVQSIDLPLDWHGLTALDDAVIDWLLNTCPDI